MKELQIWSGNQLWSKIVIKLWSEIAIKERTSGVQQDSIKRQKSNSCKVDRKSRAVQQVTRDLEMKQFRRGFEEPGALGSKCCLKYIRGKAGENIWACRTEGTVNFLHYFILLETSLHHSGAQGMFESLAIRHLVLLDGKDTEPPPVTRVCETEMLKQSSKFKWKSNTVF